MWNTSCPSYPPWFHYPNVIWWGVQIMKLLITQFYSASRFFSSLSSKHFPQHHVLLLMCDIKFQAHTKYRQNYNFVYFNLYLFR
jgi:hypothetical protein